MRLGAVISTAGGLHNVFERARDASCDSLMLFTKNNRQWRARPITQGDLALWQEARAAHQDIQPLAAHASYLINIASPKDDLWEKSVQALKVELERAIMLDIPTLTFHPGSHTGSGEEAGLARIATALGRLLADLPGVPTALCLETMAGQGTNLGYRFEQLAWVLENTKGGEQLGVCFDPCHVFAAGYDLRTPECYTATMAEFDRLMGWQRIRCFHLSDSQNDLGSRRDRHTHIGEGELGLDAFTSLVNDARFQDHPAHLETPGKREDEAGEEVDMTRANLTVLRSLIEGN